MVLGQLITWISTNGFLFSILLLQFEFECRARGADILAYPPVVAGGNRSNTLHYVKNNQLIKVTVCCLVTWNAVLWHIHVPSCCLFWLNRSKHLNTYFLSEQGKRILALINFTVSGRFNLSFFPLSSFLVFLSSQCSIFWTVQGLANKVADNLVNTSALTAACNAGGLIKRGATVTGKQRHWRGSSAVTCIPWPCFAI